MARTVLTPIEFTRTGVVLTPTAGDVVNGNAIVNDGNVGVIVKNTGAVSRTLTLGITATVDDQAVASRTVTLAAGAQIGVGPFPVATYGSRVRVNVDNAELTLLPVRV